MADRASCATITAVGDTPNLPATADTVLSGDAPEPDEQRSMTAGPARSGTRREQSVDARYGSRGRLGRGGMGEVLEVQDTVMERTVALKRLLDGRGGEAALARFRREAQLTGQLDHPNIIPVYDLVVRGAGDAYFTMKRLSGRSLEQLLKAGEGTLANRLDIFVKVCDAMAFAHDKGVIHRDLKPDNIMIGSFGEVTVIDWGLAKYVGEPNDFDGPAADAPSPSSPSGPSSHSGDLTRGGAVMGTPAFMSPEQASGLTETIAAPSDVFALGVTLYTLLTGVRPFRGKAAGLFLSIVEGKFVPPREQEPSVPVELEAIVLKAMARAPGDRYPTAKELGDDVRAYVEGRFISALDYAWFARFAKWLRRNAKVVGAVAVTSLVALLAIVGATVVYVRGLNRERERAQQARLEAEQAQGEAERARDEAVQAQDEAQSRLIDATLSLGSTLTKRHELLAAGQELEPLREQAMDPHQRLRFAAIASELAGAQPLALFAGRGEGLALSRDGLRVVGTDGRGTVRVIDWVTGAEERYEGLDLPERTAPRGRAAARGRTAWLVTRHEARECVTRLEAGVSETMVCGEAGRHLLLSRSGRRAVEWGGPQESDKPAVVWDVEARTAIARLDDLGRPYDISPDDRRVVGDEQGRPYGTNLDAYQVHDLESEAVAYEAMGGSNAFFAPEPNRLIVLRYINAVAYDGDATNATWRSLGKAGFGELFSSADASRIVSDDGDEHLLWGDPTQELNRAPLDTENVVDASDDAQLVLLADRGAETYSVRPVAGPPNASLRSPRRIFAARYLDGGLAVSIGRQQNEELLITDLDARRSLRATPLPDTAASLDVSGDRATLVVGGQSGGVWIYDLVSGEQRRTIETTETLDQPVLARLFDDASILVGSSGRLARVALDDGRELEAYEPPEGRPWAIDTRGSRFAVTYRRAETPAVTLWEQGEVLPVWRSEPGDGVGVAFAHEAQWFVVALKQERRVEARDLNGTLLGTVEFPGQHPFSVAVSPDDELAVVTTTAGSAFLISTADWSVVHAYDPFPQPISAVMFLGPRRFAVGGQAARFAVFDIELDARHRLAMQPRSPVGRAELAAMANGWSSMGQLLDALGDEPWTEDDPRAPRSVRWRVDRGEGLGLGAPRNTAETLLSRLPEP